MLLLPAPFCNNLYFHESSHPHSSPPPSFQLHHLNFHSFFFCISAVKMLFLLSAPFCNILHLSSDPHSSPPSPFQLHHLSLHIFYLRRMYISAANLSFRVAIVCFHVLAFIYHGQDNWGLAVFRSICLLSGFLSPVFPRFPNDTHPPVRPPSFSPSRPAFHLLQNNCTSVPRH